ncbi:protein CyaE [Alcaligenes pakistanensis]|uniref:Protein CyaE n=1 Tax=Alcaligenes pakistanensis TaxID=1482717 RepID=A0A8H9INF8_9BURK|nr:TolC family protein [Alcaligenes pakistanensis]GHC54597.1 protein CyaE [Alcaligenes pakistanensis]
MSMSCLPVLRFSLAVAAALALAACGTPNRHQSLAQAMPEQDAIEPPQLSLAEVQGPDQNQAFPSIQANHEYSLPELIDLAQRLNPSTRIAWGEAQQAAEAAGMIQSAYLPLISASIVGGYMRSDRDDSVNILGRDIDVDYDTHLSGAVPSLTLKWLLFDFGKRAALQEAADKLAMASRITFSGVHQAVIAEVSINYFNYNSARQREQISALGLRNATLIEDIALERQRNGLGTSIEVAQARQLKAQARLHHVNTRTLAHQSYQTLLGAIGLSPDTQLQVADSASRSLPEDLDIPGNDTLKKAIAQRADVQALQAAHQASLAGINSAEASFMPKLALMGFMSKRLGSLSVGSLPDISPQSSSRGAVLALNIPLYDAGLRNKQVREAQLRADTARERVAKTEQNAYKQMIIAAEALRAALESHHAASSLVEAAQITYQGALESYKEGLTGMTLLTEAHSGLLGAQEAQTMAHTAGLVGSVNLAFAMGELNQAPKQP